MEGWKFPFRAYNNSHARARLEEPAGREKSERLILIRRSSAGNFARARAIESVDGRWRDDAGCKFRPVYPAGSRPEGTGTMGEGRRVIKQADNLYGIVAGESRHPLSARAVNSRSAGGETAKI